MPSKQAQLSSKFLSQHWLRSWLNFSLCLPSLLSLYPLSLSSSHILNGLALFGKPPLTFTLPHLLNAFFIIVNSYEWNAPAFGIHGYTENTDGPPFRWCLSFASFLHCSSDFPPGKDQTPSPTPLGYSRPIRFLRNACTMFSSGHYSTALIFVWFFIIVVS